MEMAIRADYDALKIPDHCFRCYRRSYLRFLCLFSTEGRKCDFLLATVHNIMTLLNGCYWGLFWFVQPSQIFVWESDSQDDSMMILYVEEHRISRVEGRACQPGVYSGP